MIFDRCRYGRDNYVYLLAQGADAALVDPGDAEVAAGLARKHGLRPRALLHTHGHLDHTGGSAALARLWGATRYGSAADAQWSAPDVDVTGRKELELGQLRVAIHPAPGHTAGSVLYVWEGHLLSGDTLFWGGAGRCKYGSAEQLAHTFLSLLAGLDGSLSIEPGHDYAEENLAFALDIEPEPEPEREPLWTRWTEVRAAQARGEEPAPSTLAEERKVNPFFRAEALRPVLARRGLPCRDEREAFVALRALRDAWRRGP